MANKNPRGWKYELRRAYQSSVATTKFVSLLEAHAELGRIAGENGLRLHIHEGDWHPNAFSTAYEGNDPLLGARACVTVYSG